MKQHGLWAVQRWLNGSWETWHGPFVSRRDARASANHERAQQPGLRIRIARIDQEPAPK
jgi:hypothetical protein